MNRCIAVHSNLYSNLLDLFYGNGNTKLTKLPHLVIRLQGGLCSLRQEGKIDLTQNIPLTVAVRTGVASGHVMEWKKNGMECIFLVWNMENARYATEWKISRMEWIAIFHTSILIPYLIFDFLFVSARSRFMNLRMHCNI